MSAERKACACGCGEPIGARSRFRRGHHRRRSDGKTRVDAPRPLCACGCGQRVSPPGPKDSPDRVRRFVHGHNQRGERSHRWNGGRTTNDGYVLVRRPTHPRADRQGYVREHLLVAERALGRPVPARHPVHHVDRDRSHNAPTNLVLCEDQAYHLLLEQRTRALDACGHPDWLRCEVCGAYDAPDELRLRPSGRRGSHAACERRYARDRYARRSA